MGAFRPLCNRGAKKSAETCIIQSDSKLHYFLNGIFFWTHFSGITIYLNDLIE